MNTQQPPIIRRTARTIVTYPKTIVTLSLLLMACLFTALPSLYKDTRSDAFLADDNPALLYKNKVKAQFGLSDPMVIAIVNTSPNGVFNPESLALVQWITDKVSALDNINSDRVTSLASENNITGTADGMDVTPFWDSVPSTQQAADAVWQNVSDFPLFMGNLVATNKQATLVVAEILDDAHVEDTYESIMAIVRSAPYTTHNTIHVAGEGAIAGFLGSYIDADAKWLNPLAGIIISIVIIYAFRRVSPSILSNIIIAASVLMTLSLMALNDVPFFVITNALPVILIGISVADSIHIYSHYFELQAKQPTMPKHEVLVHTLEAMWRPITLTTLTTMAGFLGLYFAAYMPPFQYFGLYTAVGVAIAWLYSLFFLPAAMAILKPSASTSMRTLAKNNTIDRFSAIMVFVGSITLRHPKAVIGTYLIIILSGVIATGQLTVDEDRINTFHPSEPLYQADQSINRFFNGTNTLDVVIEAAHPEDLFEPENLRKMEALQDFALTLPHVNGATSIVDYLKQMNRALTGGAASQYRLPEDKDLIAQYFLIYSASSDPTDFEEEVDYDYRVANIRLTLNKGGYSHTRDTVEAINQYIASSFTTSNIQATLSGRVNVNYHWIKDLGESHFIGLALSLLLVWVVSSLLFGSFAAGSFALIPVASAILLVYSAMVLLGIHLGIGTSMFASVAIGLGVDFSIHTIDRLRSLYREHEGDWVSTLTHLYPSTGRALFFNYLAIAIGFGVLISSQVVPLNNFGTIVVVAVTTSFVASMTLLPALIGVIKPRFISAPSDTTASQKRQWIRVSSIIVLMGMLASVFLHQSAEANTVYSSDNLPSADTVIQHINAINDGDHVTRHMTMKLTDKRGKVRVRETKGYRKYFGTEKRTILLYKKPSNVKGTAFLTFDYADPTTDDDQWLYLPALRKVRRISASDRGDYFLGTDFTYDDIKLEGKLSPNDHRYVVDGFEPLLMPSGNSVNTIKVSSTPISPTVAKELGYGRTEFWVDVETWFILKTHYWGPKGQPLKTLTVADIRVIDSIPTRHNLTIRNHKTGHTSEFIFSDVDYQSPVADSLFTKRAMKRGN